MSTNTPPQQSADMGVSQAQAIASLPPDVMLMKMENEQIMSVARATPRDPMDIVKKLQQLIDAYPAAADDAIYRKPVGTVMKITCECGIEYETNIKWVQRKPVAEPEPCPECGEWKPKKQESVKKYAEGLSARAAESIRSIFGYTRLATSTEILPDGNAKLLGTLVDYAAGNITTDERIVSRHYKARSGQMVSVAEDRFLNVTVKSELSKLRRDVILLSTPNIVKACFQDACEAKIRGLISDEVIAQKIIPAFEAVGISPADLDKIIGRPHALGWKEENRIECRKILTALKNDETTVRELLNGIKEQPTNPQRQSEQSAGATMDDLTSSPDQSKPAEKKGSEPLPTQLRQHYIDLVNAAETLKAVKEVVAEADASGLTVAEKNSICLSADVRQEAIRENRGTRTNGQGDLFSNTPNAQEA